MAKEYLDDTVLFVHENTHEVDKHCLQANLNSQNIAVKYQAPLWHKTFQNLAGIVSFENIRLI